MPTRRRKMQEARITSLRSPQGASAGDVESSFFTWIERSHRVVWACVAALGATMALLDKFGGFRVQQVIDFISGIPQR